MDQPKRQLPLVSTEGQDIVDPKVIELLLYGILPDAKFSHLRGALSVMVGTMLPAQYSLVESAIEKFLVEGPADAVKQSALARFYNQNPTTLRVGKVYDPSTKENWKGVYWPNPSAPEPHGRPLYGELPFAKRLKSITKSTPIGSAGSCFAQEIMKHLKSLNYNYVMTEPNDCASANWGPQYNAVAFQQTVEWSFGLRERPSLVWKEGVSADEYSDPFREGVIYKDLSEVSTNLKSHRRAAREALETSEVFILTVGLNEVWWLGQTDTILARFPRKLSSFFVRNEVLTIEQNVIALQGAFDILRSFNPKIKMIVTVSPVPLYATFQADDMHVVVATQQAKAILRLAIEKFAKQNLDSVSYFPAMETVLWCTKNPWDDDRRHVSREAVSNVMRLFSEIYFL